MQLHRKLVDHEMTDFKSIFVNVVSEELYDKTVKQTAMKVIKMMHDSLSDKYKLYGHGRINVKAVRDVCLMVGRWILMLSVESGCTEKLRKLSRSYLCAPIASKIALSRLSKLSYEAGSVDASFKKYITKRDSRVPPATKRRILSLK